MTVWRRQFLKSQFALFAGDSRAGIELSIPAGLLRRRGRRAAPAPERPAQAVAQQGTNPGADALMKQVSEITWYHTIDLGGGVVTPGFYDHRGILPSYGLPERMDGLRVLDVASFDGFWAYEFERRGAAEVVALDIRTARELDLPWRLRARMTEADLDRRFGAGFELASRTLGSRVRHVHSNVYDLAPEKHGTFDFVHCGDLLLHLRDPARALYNIRQVTRGQAFISDVIYPDVDRHDLPMLRYEGGTDENIWWRFGAFALAAMIRDAGFDQVEETARFRYGPRAQPATMWHAVYTARP